MVTGVVGGGYRICAGNFLDPLVLGLECFTIMCRCPLGYRPVKEWEHQMPSTDFATPVSSAPSDRLALGVGWVRPGVAGIGGTLNTLCSVTTTSVEGDEE